VYVQVFEQIRRFHLSANRFHFSLSEPQSGLSFSDEEPIIKPKISPGVRRAKTSGTFEYEAIAGAGKAIHAYKVVAIQQPPRED
jgi:hypothetical protein